MTERAMGVTRAFVSDGLADVRRLRQLTIVDDCTRECLALEVDASLPGMRMEATLDRLAELRGLPLSIAVDHGPECAGKVFDASAYRRGVCLTFIRPGKPVENAYIESFSGRLRDECLNEHRFINMAHARSVIERWRIEYNTERPHSALGYLTPAWYAAATHEALALRVSAKKQTIEISSNPDSIPSPD